ncbi:uncharacterized protein LOC128873457 [Hylaeus volcanicus]|uniref:uncharacterized protein LOC128873457 n=1 Tax=Hylaeus volcanicus TaxID=313075 RepID=UPI0023B815A6|nr:uncharacterized protein LOC128873457 [Hylaeus volcanicus]
MRSNAIYIATILLVIGLSHARTSGRDLSKASAQAESVDEPVSLDNPEDAEILDSKEDGEEEEDRLPILPPIILLDFGNGTEDESVTSEEKSKRTVNSGLGYGLEQNVLQPRKYNYYFPAGKSGTTVSIEESISPFLPKTIIEKIQPTNRAEYFHGTRHNSFGGIQAQSQTQSNQYLNYQQSSKSQPVFGSRTKPQKPQTNFGYQNFPTTQKPAVSSFGAQYSGYRNIPTTTQSSLAFSSTETVGYATSSPGSYKYAATGPFSANMHSYSAQRQNTRSRINPQGLGSVAQTVETSTVAPSSYDVQDSAQLSGNGPRYTVEDGIRYENKIFWKYPDGRVSDVPPATYVEYPQFTGQRTKSQGASSIYEATTTENTVLSQGPVQFPTVVEQNEQQANTFVSAESLSSSFPQQQVYRLGYQNLVTQKQQPNLAHQRKPTVSGYSFSSSYSGRTKPSSSGQKLNYESLYSQIPSRYQTNSPNAEYTDSYVTEPTINTTTPVTSVYGPSGESSRIATKYTPKVQNYLDTILSENEQATKQSLSNSDLNSYNNLQYSDLLNYNPSISEYIRNPSSILNVRPTFVQAGNSLIPVIILRVDGASPIQPKPSQNINLKALLQQYLIQYANSIQELARPSTYNLGTESIDKDRSSGIGKSPVLDLIRLTQQDARSGPSYDSNSYNGRSSYETSNLDVSADLAGSHYGERSTARQKVKNVQIVDDPRFTTYKVKS